MWGGRGEYQSSNLNIWTRICFDKNESVWEPGRDNGTGHSTPRLRQQ